MALGPQADLKKLINILNNGGLLQVEMTYKTGSNMVIEARAQLNYWMSNYNKNKSNWFKELVTIIIGGSLIGLFSLFLLPPIAIKYWWLIWLIASTGILLWRVLPKKKNPSQKKGVDQRSGLDSHDQLEEINYQLFQYYLDTKI